MPASEAQVRANQANAQKSTGPRTAAGKEKSRANALKHGLTGAGVVMPEHAAIEIKRRYEAYGAELKASGEVASALVLRIATHAVRMEISASLETKAVAAAVRKAILDCDVPEGADDAEINRILIDAGDQVALEPTKEIIAIRKYEAAAERGFCRSLKQLRQFQKDSNVEIGSSNEELLEHLLASFKEGEAMDADLDSLEQKYHLPPMPKTSRPAPNRVLPTQKGRVDVPITIGKSR